MSKILKDCKKDLDALKKDYNISYLMSIFSNRGFHSLFLYRISHTLWTYKIPLIPMILTRIIQIIYSVDIDYKCQIEGGVIIIHGVGTVIGSGAKIAKGTKIYHQVTLGIKGSGIKDGFPIIGKNVVLGAGSKLLGNITIGDNSIVGANVVLTNSLKSNILVKLSDLNYEKIQLK